MSDHESAHTSQITTNPLPSNHLQAMSDYTIVTKYARYNDKLGRRETWNEMVDRVRDMHLFRYGTRGVNDEINWAFEQVRQRKVLPSMRSLQYGGEAIIANDARIYNCSYSLADRSRFFSECLWLLLSGTGTGFSVQKQHVAKLPELIDVVDSTEKEIMTYTVGDTIEGWSDALQVLMDSYFKGTPLSNKEIFFDFTKIRRKGAKIRTSGGRAPGPKPLQKALKRIKRILIDAVENEQSKLRPIQVYDIVTMAADCVLAGGIRKSATIAIFSSDDEEMMQAKVGFYQQVKILTDKRRDGSWLTDIGVAYEIKKLDGEEPVKDDICDIGWYNLYPWRQLSNNSVALLRDECKFSDFENIINCAKSYGEPGFVFLDNLDYGYNPCVTKDTKLLTKYGYKTVEELWHDGGEQDYDKYKKAEEYGMIEIVNSNGVVAATNVYKTSDSSPIYEVELDNGQYIKATANHKFIRILEDGSKERIKLDELKIGDKLPLINMTSFGEYDNVDYALLAGWVAGDGSISKNCNGLQRAHVVVYEDDLEDCLPVLQKSLLNLYNLENKSTNQNPLYIGCEQNPKSFNFKKKTMESIVLGRMMAEDGCHYGIPIDNIKSTKHRVPNKIWNSTKRTICAYLRGIFSADGTVNISNSRCCLKLWQANEDYLKEIQLLLLQIGITSSINKRRNARKVLMNDGNGGQKLYNSKAQFELCINSRDNLVLFNDHIQFIQIDKMDKLNDWLTNHNGSFNSNIKYYSKVKSINYIGDEETYCLTEIDNNEVVGNGIVIGQCVEIGLNPVDPKTGQTGWGVCNLTEINGGAIRSKEDFKNAVKAATIIGTLQAGYTYMSYLSDASRNIIRRESLLGVSVTGWMDNPEFLLNPELQREMAKYAIEVNKEMSTKIDISPASRITCTKPAGSTSVVLGTGSGIHPHHARYYFRRVRMNRNEKPAQYFKLYNPHMVEPSLSNEYDDVITFCVQVPESAVIKKDIGAVDFLKMVKATYENWVVPGTADPDSSPGLTHNVSNTVTIKADEWDDVAKFIYENKKCFSGISMLADFGDKAYKQAPMEKVESEEDIEKWNKLIESYQPVDWELFKENDDFTEMQTIVACANGSCDINF